MSDFLNLSLSADDITRQLFDTLLAREPDFQSAYETLMAEISANGGFLTEEDKTRLIVDFVFKDKQSAEEAQLLLQKVGSGSGPKTPGF